MSTMSTSIDDSIPQSTSNPLIDLEKSFVDLHASSLLMESLSMDSLSTVSSEPNIPPFPPGCMVPMSTILNVSVKAGELNATITVPTPPRLRTMLMENLCIEKWAESLSSDTIASDHTPWGDPECVDAPAWVPEGSMYPPEEFRASLQNKRHIWEPTPPTPRTSTRTSVRKSTYHRDNLVFERKITLRTEGETKRWSVKIPANTMESDVVDMMLQLRDLNKYFSDTPGPEEEAVSPPPSPPSLMVSNSHFAVPISLDSLGTINSKAGAPTSIATRRQKSLPPLSLNDNKMKDIVYPDIPTAFLGTPSYAPHFDPTSVADESMNLQDMVGSLRSRCSSLQVKTPQDDDFNSIRANPPLDDEWAFADVLSQPFLSPSNYCATTVPPSKDDSFALVTDDQTVLLDETLVGSAISMLKALDPNHLKFHGPPSGIPPVASDYLPPSSPLPSCPVPTNAILPRGILKRCKSVRFASSSQEYEIPVQSSASPRSRHTTGTSTPLSHRAMKRHAIKAPTSKRVPPQDITPSKDQPTFLHAAERQKPRTIVRSTVMASPPRVMSTPPVERRPTSLRFLTKTTVRHSQPAVSSPISTIEERLRSPTTLTATTNASPLKSRPSHTSPLGRYSFGRAVVNALQGAQGVGSGKENQAKSKASLSPAGNPSKSTIDENSIKRGRQGEKKSRMPLPLKNILTRFK
ncbi:uncharacterized protein BT62DRAFT_951128 [Guyanagaster necrorhizus]|uniref:Uncharacterized protein n=1 Tax=Guyanagaster necrorhizus TaxID=856835 RepID=A0A9P7VR29_9AGAR|nr:uncharacterized protein BT62DRAFT_951128 [Guyanagaster necrorhizus MCA 3950]KAG7444900.1 hypothetical protein BT62DRAFT_951128 [Guyanagaster necrorhizus MCA 3950]